MLSLRQFPVGRRLTAGFLLTTVALCVVAALGIKSISDSKDQSKALLADAKEVRAVRELVGRGHEMSADVVQHLYVYDGDLAAQDKLGAELAANIKDDRKVIEELNDTTHGSEQAEIEAFVAQFDTIVGIQERALLLSRQETVDEVDERVGSRNVFIDNYIPALDAWTTEADELTKQLETSSKRDVSGYVASTERAEATIIGVGAFSVLAAILFGWAITRSITRPVARLRDAAAHLAVGDADAAGHAVTAHQVGGRQARDEVAEVEDAVVELVEYMHQASEVAGAIALGDTTQEVNARSDGDQLGVAMSRMVDSASEMAQVAERIAGGDLEVEAPVRGESDTLGLAFRRMVDDLGARERQRAAQARIDEERAEADAALLSDLAATSEQLATASGTSERTASEVTAGMEEIAASIAQLAINAQRQVAVLQQAASGAAEAASSAEGAHRVVGEGVASVDRASGAMETLNASAQHVSATISELSHKSEQVGSIVDTITSIADQTNLLALNAAIEAARAGDQGRGFAVVADEVRKLAEESQQSASQIRTIVQEIRTETDRTVSAVAESLEHASEGSRTVAAARIAFLDIERSVQEVAARAEEISSSAAEAVELSEQASSHTEQVSAATEQAAASMQEMSATASELSQLAATLSDSAKGNGASTAPQQHLEATGPTHLVA